MNPPAPGDQHGRPCQPCEPADIAGIYSQNALARPRAASAGYNPARWSSRSSWSTTTGPLALAPWRPCAQHSDGGCRVHRRGLRLGRWQLGGRRAAWPRARVLRFEENVGFCVGCNRGAEAGRAAARVRQLRRPGRARLGPPLAGLLDDLAVSISTGLLSSTVRLSRLPAFDRAEHRRGRTSRTCAARGGARRANRRPRRDRRADDGAAAGVSRPRRLLRAVLHVRRGGGLLPARAWPDRPAPGERDAA